MDVFDYVIVGGGAAGCVLANRLSENPAVRVALIEQGPERNSRRAIIRIPLGMVTFMAPALAWLGGPKFMQWFHSEPEPGLDGRRLPLPRGKGTGGCTLVNGQIYIRGQREDYDGWRDGGAPGWGYDDLLPYFRKIESLTPVEPARVPPAARGAAPDPALHGTDGLVSLAPARSFNLLVQVFLHAAALAGHRFTADFNGARQDGFGLYSFTQAGGERVTAESAYLEPARGRPNLIVRAGRTATRLRMDGARATGVEWRDGAGATGCTQGREIFLSAGSFASPHLLMLSGIGDPAALRPLGIDPVVDLPGVGQNLQDHLDITLEYRATSRAPYAANWRMLPRNVLHVLDWLVRRRGLLASTTAESGAFLSTTGSDRPDVQLFFCTALANTQHAKGYGMHGVMMHVCQLRPGSRGALTLQSADPAIPPSIRYRFFQGESTTEVLREGVRLARRIMAQQPFVPHLGAEMSPGPQVSDDAAIDAFIRQSVGTLFHPVGTCAMGPVVDPASMRVHGTKGLRVVDASVMPTVVSGNTLAATYCLAEKAADMIRSAAE